MLPTQVGCMSADFKGKGGGRWGKSSTAGTFQKQLDIP